MNFNFSYNFISTHFTKAEECPLIRGSLTAGDAGKLVLIKTKFKRKDVPQEKNSISDTLASISQIFAIFDNRKYRNRERTDGCQTRSNCVEMSFSFLS